MLILYRAWERNKLNERAIYFRTFFFLFAIIQATLHQYYDYDEVSPPHSILKEKAAGTDSVGIHTRFLTHIDTLSPMFRWDPQNWAKSLPENIVLRTFATSLVVPFIYQIFVRRKAWAWCLTFASILWDIPETPLSFIPPNYPSLVRYTITAGFQLVFLWQASNALFLAYVSQPPIKRGQPLSSDSVDPTGTLLNGLKSRKEIPKVCSRKKTPIDILTTTDFLCLGFVYRHVRLPRP